MLSKWGQELEQSTGVESRGSQCEGDADKPNNTSGDGKSENEEEGEAEDSDSESELLLRETLKKQQYRKRKRRQNCDSGDGGGKVETVTGEIPVDILKRISPLSEKMGLTKVAAFLAPELVSSLAYY